MRNGHSGCIRGGVRSDLLGTGATPVAPPPSPSEPGVSTLVVVLVVTVVVAVAVIGWIVATYNGLVRRRNAVTNAWSPIKAQLKRRYDLIRTSSRRCAVTPLTSARRSTRSPRPAR